MIKDERYPIGPFECPEIILQEELQKGIHDIKSLSNRLKALTQSLSREELAYTYREGSWSIQQIVHHIVDSHLNGYIRMKMALTEEKPTVKTYEESKWAELDDYEMPIEVSLTMLEALHTRWVYLLENLTSTQLKKRYMYPDMNVMRVEQSIALYAWHGNHHVAHIQQALNRNRSN